MPRKVINVTVLETRPSTINLVPEFSARPAQTKVPDPTTISLISFQTSAELISHGDFGDGECQNE